MPKVKLIKEIPAIEFVRILKLVFPWTTQQALEITREHVLGDEWEADEDMGYFCKKYPQYFLVNDGLNEHQLYAKEQEQRRAREVKFNELLVRAVTENNPELAQECCRMLHSGEVSRYICASGGMG